MTFGDIIFINQNGGSPFYNSPLISGLIGLLGVYLGFWLKERNESSNYEFYLLSKTKDLLDTKPINISEIIKFYNELHFDLKARKLKSSKIITSALLNAKNNKPHSIEDDKIKARLKELSEGGILSKIKKTFLAIMEFFNPFSQSPPFPPQS